MGVFSINLRPKLTTVGTFCILNTNCYPCTVTQVGHWVVIFCKNPNVYYFFDSYGRAPDFYGVAPPNINIQVIYSTKQIQAFNTAECGIFCILYCAYMKFERQPTLLKFLNFFDAEDLRVNNDIVKRFFSRL